MELMKNQSTFKESIVRNRENEEGGEQDGGSGHPDLPKNVEDVDRVNLGNVVTAATPRLFNKILKSFEKDYGLKMRKISKNQCTNVFQILCS